MEYIDQDVFIALAYLGFQLEQKVNNAYKCFPKFIVF